MKISLIRFSIGLRSLTVAICILVGLPATVQAQVTSLQPSNPALLIKDDVGNITAFIDQEGDFETLDLVVYMADDSDLNVASPVNDFIVKNDQGSVVARLNSEDGRLFLKGGLIENAAVDGRYCSSTTPLFIPQTVSDNGGQYPSNPNIWEETMAFILQNDSGENVAWIDNEGNMMTKGSVQEDMKSPANDRGNVIIEMSDWFRVFYPISGGVAHVKIFVNHVFHSNVEIEKVAVGSTVVKVDFDWAGVRIPALPDLQRNKIKLQHGGVTNPPGNGNIIMTFKIYSAANGRVLKSAYGSWQRTGLDGSGDPNFGNTLVLNDSGSGKKILLQQQSLEIGDEHDNNFFMGNRFDCEHPGN